MWATGEVKFAMGEEIYMSGFSWGAAATTFGDSEELTVVFGKDGEESVGLGVVTPTKNKGLVDKMTGEKHITLT